MAVNFVHVGFGNMLAIERVVAIMSPDSVPVKRMVQESRGQNRCIDMTKGRKTKSVLVLDSGHVVLVAITPDTIAGRLLIGREAVAMPTARQALRPKRMEGSSG